jgi:hypothetical protein
MLGHPTQPFEGSSRYPLPDGQNTSERKDFIKPELMDLQRERDYFWAKAEKNPEIQVTTL